MLETCLRVAARLQARGERQWIQRCAQALIRMRPRDDIEALVEASVDLWSAYRHVDPVDAARIEAQYRSAR
jgi:hypothetical protein